MWQTDYHRVQRRLVHYGDPYSATEQGQEQGNCCLTIVSNRFTKEKSTFSMSELSSDHAISNSLKKFIMN